MQSVTFVGMLNKQKQKESPEIVLGWITLTASS